MDFARYTRIIDNASDKSHDNLFSEHLRYNHSLLTDTEQQLRLPEDFERWRRFAQLQYLDINSRLSDYITRTLDAASTT